jgi:hypothetical protein
MIISHWSIIVPAETGESFDTYELFQDRGRIFLDYRGESEWLRYSRRAGALGVNDMGQPPLDEHNWRDHLPVGETIKSHTDIMDIIRGGA